MRARTRRTKREVDLAMNRLMEAPRWSARLAVRLKLFFAGCHVGFATGRAVFRMKRTTAVLRGDGGCILLRWDGRASDSTPVASTRKALDRDRRDSPARFVVEERSIEASLIVLDRGEKSAPELCECIASGGHARGVGGGLVGHHGPVLWVERSIDRCIGRGAGYRSISLRSDDVTNATIHARSGQKSLLRAHELRLHLKWALQRARDTRPACCPRLTCVVGNARRRP